MSYAYFSTSSNVSLTIPLCVFNFSSSRELHSNCLQEHCTHKRGIICITSKLFNHLGHKRKVFEDKKHFLGAQNLSDQYYLIDALRHPTRSYAKEFIDYFSQTKVYRLRFKQHRDQGISLIKKLISELRTFFHIYGSIWGTSYKGQTQAYMRIFDELCSKCERSSVAGIYRLFDLFEGTKYSLDSPFPHKLHLSLLFAFGHGTSQYPELESLNHLVSKFQFYLQFAQSLQAGSLSKMKQEYQIRELGSEQLGEIAYQLWKGYMRAAAAIQRNQNTTLYHNRRIIASLE